MASIKLKGDTSGEVTISAPAVAGTTTLTLPATSSTLATQNALGVRNLIINGDMRIDQRNAGASITPTSAIYSLDRWLAECGSTASKYSVQQNAGSVTPPSGFKNYLGITSTSAYTPLSTDNFSLQHRIEGYNTAHLDYGTANAKTTTLSFWVRSSLTGTFGGEIFLNGSTARTFPYTYTINSANTWEKKTITIAGDTQTNTIPSTTAFSIIVIFMIGAGSSLVGGTANTWQNGNFLAPSGCVNLVETNGATLYITGIQLEIGTEATPFEHRPYDMELARCQRYYWKNIYNSGNAAPTLMTSAIGYNTTSIGQAHCKLPVTMRASPSSSISSNLLWWNSPSGSITAIATTNSTVDVGTLNFTTTGVSTGTVYNIISTTVGAYIDFSAEL